MRIVRHRRRRMCETFTCFTSFSRLKNAHSRASRLDSRTLCITLLVYMSRYARRPDTVALLFVSVWYIFLLCVMSNVHPLTARRPPLPELYTKNRCRCDEDVYSRSSQSSGHRDAISQHKRHSILCIHTIIMILSVCL